MNLASFVVDEEIYYAAILRDMSVPRKVSASSAGRHVGDKELRIKKKVNLHPYRSCICNICGDIGFACWSNYEVYTQVNKP